MEYALASILRVACADDFDDEVGIKAKGVMVSLTYDSCCCCHWDGPTTIGYDRMQSS